MRNPARAFPHGCTDPKSSGSHSPRPFIPAPDTFAPGAPLRTRQIPPHLRAAGYAIALVSLFFMAVHISAPALERRFIARIAQEKSERKDMGLAWQRTALAAPNVIPLYGSSELTRSVDNKPQDFFAMSAAGFVVSSVGHAGCTSITLVEKIAASSSATGPGRRIAIVVSPSWFFVPGVAAGSYRNNFSPMQVSALLCNPRLSVALKQDLARRMLEFPDAIQSHPLVKSLIQHAATGKPVDQALWQTMSPLARFHVLLVESCEDITICWQLLNSPSVRTQPPRESPVDWSGLLSRADREITGGWDHHDQDRFRISGNDRFLDIMHHSKEWADFELLLRTTQELGYDVSLLDIPIDRQFYRQSGIDPASLEQYVSRLHRIALQHRVKIIEFPDHRDDRSFFLDHHDHLSAKGWLYFDQALDALFGCHRP